MKMKMIWLIVLILVVAILLAVYNIQIPCGGMTEDGAFWDGTCAYGPILLKNIQNGHFFLPFGMK